MQVELSLFREAFYVQWFSVVGAPGGAQCYRNIRQGWHGDKGPDQKGRLVYIEKSELHPEGRRVPLKCFIYF